MSRNCLVNIMMALWAYIWWLIVFLRRHRVRPTVAMAWIVEIIIIVSEGRHHFHEQQGLLQFKILSLALTAYNGLFTLCDWIEYNRSHPHLAAFHRALFVLATLHLTASFVVFLRYHLEWLVSPLGLTVATMELYGADAYFAAQEAYKDTHPQMTRLTPGLPCFTQLSREPQPEPSSVLSMGVNSPSSSSPLREEGIELRPGWFLNRSGLRPRDTQIQSCSCEVEGQLERDEQTSEEYHTVDCEDLTPEEYHTTTSEFDGQKQAQVSEI